MYNHLTGFDPTIYNVWKQQEKAGDLRTTPIDAAMVFEKNPQHITEGI